jgi:glucan-binding YG repeat protein
MTVILKNHKNGKEREFDDVEEAEDTRSELIGIGAKPDNLEIIEDTSEATAESRDDSSPETGNGTQQTETTETRTAAPVDEQPSEEETVQTQKTAGIDTINDEEEFVTEVKGVPQTFVVNMGTAQNKSIHIKKEGYYYLASKMGIDFGAEPIKTSVELDGEKAIYRGWAEKDGQRWENVGTAHLPGEDMQGAEYNLDELAATRAACRALSMATGTGVASMEEMVNVED